MQVCIPFITECLKKKSLKKSVFIFLEFSLSPGKYWIENLIKQFYNFI